MYNKVLVGTEFTFRHDRNDDFVFGLDALGWDEQANEVKTEAISHGEAHIEAADKEIERWTEQIKSTKKFRRGDAIFYGAEVEEGHKKHASKCYRARKVKLALGYKKEGEYCQEYWTINFDLDPNCIEIQAQPATYDFYSRYNLIIGELLFYGKSCSPYPDAKMGGGGHISLDLATAFENNPQYLKNFLVLYAVLGNNAKCSNMILRKCQDVMNAPFMNEIDELNDFIRVITEFNRLTPAEATMERLVHDINTQVYTKAHDSLREMNVPATHYPHYQAVNLENVIVQNPTPERMAQRRVELRRFEAQENIDELLQELNEVYSLLEKSKPINKLGLDNEAKLIRIE